MTEPIITSMLDDDMYKVTQQAAFLELYPNEVARYRFKNRGPQRFTREFVNALLDQIYNHLPHLALTPEEKAWMKKKMPFLKPAYIEFFDNYRYNPALIKTAGIDADGNLVFDVEGRIVDGMMWEVKMMAIISELYFKLVDTNWSMDGQDEKAYLKSERLTSEDCVHVDFGTRRRRSYETQDLVVSQMKKHSHFAGTSNMHLAMKHGVTPKGTQAHEFYQAMQALEGIRHSNRYALENWVKVFNGNLGIALPDTLGSANFLRDFDLKYAKLFDGVRWDSGDPYWFTDLFRDYYRSLSIDPMSKSIIYSNALNCDRAIDIRRYCEDKIKRAFGIGTFFTSDFEGSPALNMVIKLWSVNGIPVVKTSDDIGKLNGDPEAAKVTQWIMNSTPLCNGL